MEEKVYAVIDLKSFFASAECAERGLDPFTTNLVVADPDRERGTICLAITPAMKALGVKNRCRVYEIPAGIPYIMAKPRMSLYMAKSAQIVGIYLRYVSPDDIHVYSIDEVFIDLTPYLSFYHQTAKEICRRIMDEIMEETGIASSAGIGTNMFLAKVALDITAKHAPDRMGYLDEEKFRKEIWYHRPITDVWNIGPGTAARLKNYGVFDLHGVTLLPETTLYRAFGVLAENLINHAWGREKCTIADIRNYVPATTSLSHSQVLFEPYSFDEARMIVCEMIETTVLDMIAKRLASGRVSLHIGYESDRREPTGGSHKLTVRTSSLARLRSEFLAIYDKTTDFRFPVRRIALGFEDVVPETYTSIDLFTDEEAEQKEHSLLKAMNEIKRRYGKNAIVRAANFDKKSTVMARNGMIGGHNAG
ncbi:MAG: DNA repair protein [Clostridia bacterium]|nr:DNA repair protein [Clostridia bacterium]